MTDETPSGLPTKIIIHRPSLVDEVIGIFEDERKKSNIGRKLNEQATFNEPGVPELNLGNTAGNVDAIAYLVGELTATRQSLLMLAEAIGRIKPR